jgi:pimeloyl-ACP methyl ester carboxylesterase
MRATIDQIITLKDGRKLGFNEYGDRQGKPVFFFHGWPSSRLHAARFETAAKKLHIRLISIDRPGFGLSDPKPNRTLLDFPDDIKELADNLVIKKFSVIGVSGGAPYAVVCAYKLAKNLEKVGVVVGLAPPYIKGICEGMAFLNRLGWENYRRFPFLAKLSAYLGYLEVKLLPTNLSSLLVGKPDKAMSDNQFRAEVKRSRTETYKQGYRGASTDLKVYSADWGFNLKKIAVPVFLWYGDADKNVSLKMAEYYYKNIPNSQLTIYQGEGHYCQITHAEEILALLVK